jgi:hypothetical protein
LETLQRGLELLAKGGWDAIMLEEHVKTADSLFHGKAEETDATKCPRKCAPFTLDITIDAQEWEHTKVKGVQQGSRSAERSG